MGNFKFGQPNKIDTMDVVSKMMETKMSQISPIAFDYLKDYAKVYGFCGEVMVTAFAHYCQAVLGLPCNDRSYVINEEELKWFTDNGYTTYEKTDKYKPYSGWVWN